MSDNSFTRCWLHYIWGTKDRASLLSPQGRARTSRYLQEYAKRNGIYMKIKYVNDDHVHALLDLPANLSIEMAGKLLKGASSYWINQNGIGSSRFRWQRGHGAFSVSQSRVAVVCRYTARQEEHHRSRTFQEEYAEFLNRYGLVLTPTGVKKNR